MYIVLIILILIVDGIFIGMLYVDLIESNKTDLPYHCIIKYGVMKIISGYLHYRIEKEKNNVSSTLIKTGIPLVLRNILGVEAYNIKNENPYRLVYKAERRVEETIGYIFSIIDFFLQIVNNVYPIVVFAGKGVIPFIGLCLMHITFYFLYYRKRIVKIANDGFQAHEKVNGMYKKLNALIAGTYDRIVHNETGIFSNSFSLIRHEIETFLNITSESTGFIHFANVMINQIGIMIILLTCNIGSIPYMIGTLATIERIYKFFEDRINVETKFDAGVSKEKKKCRDVKIDYEQIPVCKSIGFRNIRYVMKNDTDSEILQTTQREFVLTTYGDFNFTIGDVIKVTGNSGHGKSTLMDVIAGVYNSHNLTGQIMIDGIDVDDGFKKITDSRTYTMQNYDNNVDFNGTPYQIITGTFNSDVLKGDKDDDYDVINELLIMVNLKDVIDQSGGIHTEINSKLSGGQKMKMGLAKSLFRAINKKTPIVILDEPDKGLPVSESKEIINRIIDRCREFSMVFIISHSLINNSKTIHVENGTISLL